MKDEDIIGEEFEAVAFEHVPSMRYSSSLHRPLLGRTGIAVEINKVFPHLCLVKFNKGIGPKCEVHFPVAVIKQQIENRTPVNLDDLFKQIKSL